MSSASDETTDITLKRPAKSRLISRLLTIPIVNIAVRILGTIVDVARRKSPLLDSFANRGERVFYAVITSTCEDKLTQNLEGSNPSTSKSVVCRMNTVWSASIMSSKKILHQGSDCIHQTTRNSARYILHTIPGRIFMWTFGLFNGALITLLYFVRPDLRHAQKQPVDNGSMKQSLNSLSENVKKDTSDVSIQILTLIVQPFVFLVGAVEAVHGYLHQIADRDQTSAKVYACLSPDKQTEILSRRKVSPKKKLKFGFLNRLQNTARYFGLSKLVPGLKRRFNVDVTAFGTSRAMTSPNKLDDDEKKRKYEDIISESGTETEEEGSNLQTLDLENYISDEDPDYIPADAESTDSDEYKEDTESDTDLGSLDTVRTLKKTVVHPDCIEKIENKKTVEQPANVDRNEIKKTAEPIEKTEIKPEAATQNVQPKKVVHPQKPQQQSESNNLSNDARTKDPIKTTPVKFTNLSVESHPQLGHTKTSPAEPKSSTPKQSSKKDNPTYPEPSFTTSDKKATPADPKSGTFESGVKKADTKSSQMANGDKKTKGGAMGGKKSAHWEKK